LKIDSKKMAWPMQKAVKIEGLDMTAPHLVVIYCVGKQQQAVRFRFSTYRANQLCLFLNDLYKTAHLEKRCRWCKCI
jgi:hypothetical protein